MPAQIAYVTKVCSQLLIVEAVEDGHGHDVVGVGQVRQQLGREHETLGGPRAAGSVHHLDEHLALVDAVHALVDLVHHPEGRHRHMLRQAPCS